MQPVSIAFFDDHPILLDGLARIFSMHRDYEVATTGRCADDIVEAARTLAPDVMVVDLSMPGNVLEAIQTVTGAPSNTHVVVFTASAGVDVAVRALESGATGYVLKGSSSEELITAIRSVLAGDTFVTPSFATKVITSLRQSGTRGAAGDQTRLSVREDQIIRLLQCGRTNREIATQLRISEKTVKHYMTLLMQKLNVRNRLEVIIAAQRLGHGDSGHRPSHH